MHKSRGSFMNNQKHTGDINNSMFPTVALNLNAAGPSNFRAVEIDEDLMSVGQVSPPKCMHGRPSNEDFVSDLGLGTADRRNQRRRVVQISGYFNFLQHGWFGSAASYECESSACFKLLHGISNPKTAPFSCRF